MILDNQALFSDKQALAAAVLTPSTNILDLGDTGITGYNKVKLKRNMDNGHTPLLIQAVEAFTGAVTNVKVAIEIADDEAFAVNKKEVISVDIAVADLIEGAILPIDELPRGIKQRYLRIAYTPNGVVATGKFTSGIVGAVDASYQG